MDTPVLYVFAPRSDISPALVRREIFWLTKDRLIDTDQTGWSLSHGQIEPYPSVLDEGVLARLDVESQAEVLDSIYGFLKREDGFILPLSERIEESHLAERLAGVERMGVLPQPSDPSLREVEHVGTFWQDDVVSIPELEGHPARRAAFNIAHPYAEGPFWASSNGEQYHLSPSGIEGASTENGPVYSIHARMEGSSVDLQFDDLREILHRLPTGTGLAVSNHCDMESRFAMNELDLETGALSAGSVLVEWGEDSEGPEAAELVERFDRLGISLAGDFPDDGGRRLLFKFHPRHSETDEAGPAFGGARERRKLGHTEWARDVIPGYKHLESGSREVEIARFDEWHISTRRPGRKDADDFTYHLSGPDLVGKEETKPYLHRVFIDVGRHLHCPESGLGFLEALYRLWGAEVPMENAASFVGELDYDIPPCTIAADLWYDRRVLLYALALQFIVEDLNYRFNFHPTYGGPSYRKQGRDQPMNGLLRVGAIPYDEQAFEDIAESTKEGGLIHRPEAFDGPDHLRTWYVDHGMGGSG